MDALDFEAAGNALRETKLRRIGSPERVAEVDRQVKRSALYFVAAGLPTGLIAYWLMLPISGRPIPQPGRGWLMLYHGAIIPDLRIDAAILIAILGGLGSGAWAARKARRDQVCA